ncbi:transporter substrate-binding domain-containing protein [Tianweitania populi]|uniref:ABC transporter substrate-binding protein n=1 Tax=Tianweitania populi TaxID=1607949 RepID=A0A8J3DYN6_9HYPH|nr:transporter substrate-binding domain-containing protein [Tianweitania populi]GHD19396.1 ABC transporter substrate-binding protein [Tianweitania populi]
MNFKKTFAAAAACLALMIGVQSAEAQTVEELKQRGVVKIGTPLDFPPFGSIDLNGEPVGYDVDVAKALAAKLGVKIEIVPVSGPNRIPYLQSNQIDVIVSSMGVTPERAKQVSFTQAYAGIEQVVFGDKNVSVNAPEDMSGKSVALVRASTQDGVLVSVAPSDVNIRRFDDDATVVQALLSGQTQLVATSSIQTMQIDKRDPGRFDVKFKLPFEQRQAIAIRPGNDQLLTFINDLITEMKSNGELEALSQKWVGSPLPAFVLNDRP